jgi:hypothetical protein
MYNPSLAAFNQRDPIGYEGQDGNLYRYVANDPIDFADPEGLQKKPAKPGKPEPAPAAPVKPRPPGDTTGFTPCGSFEVSFKPVKVTDPSQIATLGGTSVPGYVITYIPDATCCPGGKIVLVQAVDHGAEIKNGAITKLPAFDGDVGPNGEWPIYNPRDPCTIKDRPYNPNPISTNWYTAVCAVCVRQNPYSQRVLGCVNLKWNDDPTNPCLSVITKPGVFIDTKVPVPLNKPPAKFPAACPGKTWCKAEENYCGEK